MKISKRSFPIHVHIITIIIFVVAIASGTQMALSNKAMSEVIFQANSKLFERIAGQTKYQLNSNYGTAFSALGRFSNSHSLNTSVGFERLRVVPEVIHLLSQFDHVQTYTFSFKDGDYVVVKRITEELIPDIVINNQLSQYIVAHEIGGVVEVNTYDRNLNFVERLDVNEEEFHLAYQDNSLATPGRNTISKRLSSLTLLQWGL